MQRPKREELLAAVRRRELDAILVWRLDRWGRSLPDLVVTLKELAELAIGFVSLTEAFDMTTPTGRALAGMLAVFAEFEREIMRERVKAGIAQARDKGTALGRPKSAAKKIAEVRRLYRKEKLTKSEIARRLGIGRTSSATTAGRLLIAHKSQMAHFYRIVAIPQAGKTVEFLLSRKRHVNAAKVVLGKAMKGQRTPTKITLDAYAASQRAVADLKDAGELLKQVQVRTSKYLNNIVEQDHRRVKQRLRPMLELKSFRTAARVISGIELAEKIKKDQFKIGKLGGRGATMAEIWQAALAA